MIFALPPTGDTDLTMRIFNSDGSEPEMCGNGIRCLARFVADVDKATAKKYKIHTLAGAQHAYCAALLHLLQRRLCGGAFRSENTRVTGFLTEYAAHSCLFIRSLHASPHIRCGWLTTAASQCSRKGPFSLNRYAKQAPPNDNLDVDSRSHSGLIQPVLLPDGQVKVDMGEPILEGVKVPTTLAPTKGPTVVEQV